MSAALLVIPHARRPGFWANIRGHVLDLGDPASGHAFAPTPDDLFTASIASDVAWFSREFLRTNGMPEEVGVAAKLGSEIELTVTVPSRAEPVSDALASALQTRLAARSLASPVVHISCEE